MKIKVVKTATRVNDPSTWCPYMIDIPAEMPKQ